MNYSDNHVWVCDECRIFYPCDFKLRKSNKRYSYNVPMPETYYSILECPRCKRQIVCSHRPAESDPFSAVYICEHCVLETPEKTVFGFTRPERSNYMFFTTLSPQEARERLLAGETEKPAQAGRHKLFSTGSITKRFSYIKMMPIDPMYVVEKLRSPVKQPYLKMLTFAFEIDLQKEEENRQKQIADYIRRHNLTAWDCPFAGFFNEIKLEPDHVLLTITPSGKKGYHYIFCGILAFILSIILLLTWARKDTSGLMISALLIPISILLTCMGTYIQTMKIHIEIKGGRLVIQKKSLVEDLNYRYRTITSIQTTKQYYSGGGHIKPPETVTTSITKGLGSIAIEEYETSDRISFPLPRDVVHWIGYIIQEACICQGILKE